LSGYRTVFDEQKADFEKKSKRNLLSKTEFKALMSFMEKPDAIRSA
jgi:hypothetical protein